jgi:hypothetical protein
VQALLDENKILTIDEAQLEGLYSQATAQIASTVY